MNNFERLNHLIQLDKIIFRVYDEDKFKCKLDNKDLVIIDIKDFDFSNQQLFFYSKISINSNLFNLSHNDSYRRYDYSTLRSSRFNKDLDTDELIRDRFFIINNMYLIEVDDE